MITCCPSCHTHFRVHPEQLAARAGQVRCGKCSRVFDALDYLIEEIAPARALRPKPESEATYADAADAEPAPDIGVTIGEPLIAEAGAVVAKAPEAGGETPESAISVPANAEPVAVSGASA